MTSLLDINLGETSRVHMALSRVQANLRAAATTNRRIRLESESMNMNPRA